VLPLICSFRSLVCHGRFGSLVCSRGVFACQRRAFCGSRRVRQQLCHSYNGMFPRSTIVNGVLTKSSSQVPFQRAGFYPPLRGQWTRLLPTVYSVILYSDLRAGRCFTTCRSHYPCNVERSIDCGTCGCRVPSRYDSGAIE
jgi:hypothetical protein